MARRATPVTKGRTAPKKSPAAAKPARAGKSRPREDAPTEMPEEIQPMFAGVDEPAHEPEPPLPAKAKRGRKPKPDAMAADLGSIEDAAPMEAAPTIEPELELPEPKAKTPSSPRKTRRNREPEASAPPPLETADEPFVEPQAAAAAEWHPESGTVTFDWPAIEQVAATEGTNQPMAKLLLAARAEGAKSRWPF